jgi:hypothetical protein
LDAAGLFPKDTRDIGDAFVADSGKDALGITITRRSGKGENFYDDKPPGMPTELKLLFRREFRNLVRDTTALGARFGITIFLGVLIGTIFLDVGNSDSAVQVNIQSHFGALVIVMLTAMFGTAQPALLAFPEERPVFLREYSTNHYSVISYFLARLSNEAIITGGQIFVNCLITYFMIGFQTTFGLFFATVYSLAMASTALAVLLGCAVEDPKLGQEMLPILFVPQMLFAGFFVAPGLIPVWLRWARYLCTLTYSVRIMLVAEFDRDCGSEEGNKNCEQLLDNVGAVPEDTWWNWLVLVALFASFRFIAVFILRQKATKFF